MPIFVYLVDNSSRSLPHQKNDTDWINEILTKLQQSGAKITSVTASMSHASGGSKYILYVIAYDAPAAIAI